MIIIVSFCFVFAYAIVTWHCLTSKSKYLIETIFAIQQLNYVTRRAVQTESLSQGIFLTI